MPASPATTKETQDNKFDLSLLALEYTEYTRMGY